MMHKRRTWVLSSVATPEDLARMLTQSTWTLCSAFFVEGQPDYLFLNDSTHEDGAGEWAVLKRQPDGSFVQIESITFSWCNESKGLDYVRRIHAGELDTAEYAASVTPALETPDIHGRCHLCA